MFRVELMLWFVLLLPLGAAGLITLFTRRNQTLSAGISIAAVVGALVLSLIFIGANHWQPGESSVTWLSIGSFQVEFGLRYDPLSLGMLLVVTGVGSLIHIYSWGYMSGDPGFSRYFACLSLFTFSMLGIVLANNFLEMFIFWELVGVSSYLLIGYWFERPAAADAGKKAFLTNRLGDFGFLLGILTVWTALQTLNFHELQQKVAGDPGVLGTTATLAGLLIFCGAVGKSAQFPLHVWLPDAMEGPTPVSALIHAATMVAAGVYMLCRVFFLFTLRGSQALEVIAWIGGFTALLAAVIAVQQNDIKRILAYSTLSQLGYMVMAVGVGGPTQAMFHLTTHAFFKALLFLAAGSIIYALHHEQDIWRMGALRAKMPSTYRTFLIGTLALAGVWPLSGFFSKDSILAQAYGEHHIALFAVGVLVAALTTFYMFRLVFVVFFGRMRSAEVEHAHESPAVMVWPLVILAVLSVLSGGLGIEELYGSQLTTEAISGGLLAPFMNAPIPAALGLFAVLVGFCLAYACYFRAEKDPLPQKLGGFSRAMRHRFYFDEIYEKYFIHLHDFIAAVAAWVDEWLVAGALVRGTHGTTELLGRALRLMQTGSLQAYAFLFAAGVALVLYLALR
jgi:NADH-quinone oxidoreductase subunit L